jgi:hypothetical protein
MDHDCAGTNPNVIAEADISQHGSAGADHDAIA